MRKVESLLLFFVDLSMVFNLFTDGLVLVIIRFHPAGLIDLLIAQDPVPQVGVCHCAEIIPLSIALARGNLAQDVERVLVAAHLHIMPRSLKFRVLLLAALLLVPAGKGIIGILGRCLLGRIFDLIVGRIDVVHHFGRMGVAGIHVRVIFFCQLSVGPFYFLFRSAWLQA